VTSPADPNPKFLGGDGKPFTVNMTGLHTALAEAESEGRKTNWAGEVKWNEPTPSDNQWVGLCWGFRTDSSGNDLTYKCVDVKPMTTCGSFQKEKLSSCWCLSHRCPMRYGISFTALLVFFFFLGGDERLNCQKKKKKKKKKKISNSCLVIH
jgi:hypothetical protein